MIPETPPTPNVPRLDSNTYADDHEDLYEIHNVYSVTLVELKEEGFFAPDDPSWAFPCDVYYLRKENGDIVRDEKYVPQYDEERNKALFKEIYDRFYLRNKWKEICIVPPNRWRDYVIDNFRTILPTAAYRLRLLDEFSSIKDGTGEYGKRRNIFSDFPASAIEGQYQDYASNSNDNEWEIVRSKPVSDVLDKLLDKDITDPVDMILSYMDRCFSALVTYNLNGV